MVRGFKKTLQEIKEGKIERTLSIGHVDYYMIEKTPYSFHFYAVFERSGRDVLTELLYDLRNKEYFIKRNGREIKFNVDNLDSVIPRTKDFFHDKFYNRENVTTFFNMVSVEENKGMYEAMVRVIGSIGGERVNMSSRALIRLITEYNKLELIYKSGMDMNIVNHGIVRERVKDAGVENKRKLHQIFGLTKSQLNFLREFEDTYHRYYGNNIRKAQKLTQRDMDTYRGYQELIHELEEKYNIDDRLPVFRRYFGVESFMSAVYTRERIKEGYQSRYDYDFFGFITEFNFPNPKKLFEYLLFECYLSQGMEFRIAMEEYRDYYSMSMDLEYTRFERYPKYLKTYHDIIARNYRVASSDIENKKFAEVTDKYKHLEDSVGKLVMVAPTEPKDLITEGNVLGHCVASYVKNVVNERTRIMFLRHKGKEDEPYITVEIRDNKIVQYRGRGNRLPADKQEASKVIEAVKRYAKKHKIEVTDKVM